MSRPGGTGQQQLQQQNMQLQTVNHDLRNRLGHAEMTMQKMAAQLSSERERYVNLEAEFQGTTEEMQLEVRSATPCCELTPLVACTNHRTPHNLRDGLFTYTETGKGSDPYLGGFPPDWSVATIVL